MSNRRKMFYIADYIMVISGPRMKCEGADSEGLLRCHKILSANKFQKMKRPKKGLTYNALEIY